MALLIDNEIIKITNNDMCETDEQTDLYNSFSNSNIELNYDTQHNILKTKINNKIIDIKFNKDCETKEKALYILLIKYIKHIAKKRKNNDLKYDDTKYNILKTKINDDIINIKINKNCETKADALGILLIKYIKHIEAKRKNGVLNYQKRSDKTREKTQTTKALWYQNNKERLRIKQLTNYNNDPEYKQWINDKNKKAYDKKTDGIEKQKRGRKPSDKQPIITDIEKRPRGRPKKAIISEL